MLEFASPTLCPRQSMPVDYATYLLSSSPPASTFDLLSVAFAPLTLAHHESGDQLPSTCSKSSLSERRVSPLKPIIIRSDSSDGLTSDDSAPGSPQSPGRHKKKVSFADLRGKALATVRLITEPSDTPPKLNPSILSSVTQGAHADVTEQPPLKLCFTQPASDYLAFRDKVEKSYVCLENVILKDYDVVGTIKVNNVAFEKRVFVRCTFDTWQTYNDVPATYLPGPGNATGRGNMFDTFSFEFSVPTNMEVERKVEFAVCFATGDAQYWDNNSGANYQIVFTNCRPRDRPRFVTDPKRSLTDVPMWTEYAGWDRGESSTTYY
ncbi:protein phosphatase 1 regulatory subunit 3B-like [Gigantopelta aegis]|uniref:protein phosphatase 1 regulatory subunit 3B-like n=1 Tax=Gigantopelta aegis TaxID=1735272 RepID=UPI001B88766A|nr:protein phosphatase 1 regulatory subunit 3B-like [Gigantopelta aegis]